MKKVYLSLVIVLLSFLTWNAIAQTTTYSYSGVAQQYTVPPCTYFLTVDVQGAQGGNSYYGYAGGLGGRVQATLAVTPGQILQVYVGQQGPAANVTLPGNPGGWNGGGQGTAYGGSGGGESDIRVSPYSIASRIVVAGAGAGGAQSCVDPGASAGGTAGANGNYCGSYSSSNSGAGGTQTAGGAAASSGGATAGAAGVGGNAAHGGYFYYGFFGTYYRYYYYNGSGGGAGYYGGGGGLNGSGGGGSSYPVTGATTTYASSVTNTGAFRSGNGVVYITPQCNAVGAITGPSSVCAGATITLANPTVGAGPTGSWSSSNTSVATIDGTSGVLTGVSAGTVTITYTICNPCGALATKTITVNPTPAAITGASSVCTGATTVLSSTTTGGTWTSSSSAIGSVSSLGVVTGVSAGSITVTYTLPAGCFVTAPVVVNPSPAAITGSGSICPAITINLSDVTSGGTWSSSNTLLATVGSLTGVVTGVSGGTPVISYTLPTGCFATTIVTVNSMSPITGSPSICVGSTSSLSDLTPGGVWSSSNSAIASVSSTSGVVTGVSTGTATITYNSVSAGCFATMTVYVTNTPTAYSVIGGGHYCSGGSGVTVGLSSSTSGVTYTLFNGATAIPGTILGSGFSFNFPAQTAAGTYGIVANYGSACAVTQTGTVNITIDPLPTPFTVSGGGSYCSGTGGVHVFLNSSTIGVNYQLYVNTGGGPTPVGSPVAGTSASLDFGAQTTAGTYTVVGTNATTGCINNMSGSVTVSINPLPTAYSVTPATGGYCTGGSGVAVGVANSQVGVSYQLLLSGTALGSPIAGTGSSISFGLQTTPGVYTVLATNTTTGCTNTMSGSSTIAINSLPTVYSVTGGGSYCLGGSGVTVSLNGSQAGVNYQLYNGALLVGGAVPGTGSSISFGLQTTAGSYTVVATNASTSCVSNMFGSASVTINPLPTVFSATGGGSYCQGGTGVHVGLSGSVVGTTYNLLNGTTVVGAASGTGSPLDFGLILPPGTYTVNGTNSSTGCIGAMSSFATVVVNPLPVSTYSVTGGGNYCAGGTGVAVGLSSSQSGVSYQLLRGGIPSGSAVSGTGSAISFGLQTSAGSYTVVATNSTTGCTNTMTGSAIININPLPTAFNVTGGGGYCTGASGVHIGLSGSDIGVNYQLFNGSTTTGAPVAGVGAAIDFGLLTAAGTYTVTATNPVTGCVKGMAGSAVVTINTLPTAYAVTGGGVYCSGGAGVAVGLANSASGVNYQLMRGTTPVGTSVAGTGSAITFGSQTVAGTYSVIGTSAAGCSTTMTGTVAVSVNPLPAVFTVSGTGSYCAGGTGLPVTLSGSVVGTSYQLNYLGAPLGSAQPGTGAPVVFGPVTGAGNYTITATITATGCTNIMASSATISVNPLPSLFLVTGGGSYCSGGTGVHIGLSGSTIGVNYQLLAGGVPSGSPMPGTTAALDFGLQTTAGTYTIMATNTTTGCTQLMTGSASVAINPLPVVHNVTGGGNYCPGGTGVIIGLNGSNTGMSYQLFNGTTPMGSAVAGTGSPISFGLQTATGTYTVVATNTTTSCVGNMTGSATVGLYALPTIYNVTGGGNYCPGGTGVHVGLSGSSVGTSYQLVRGGTPVPGTVAGTGFAIDFGLVTTPGTYTITATNTATGCTNVMNGNAIINISALPATHNVTGGGHYCTGGIGLHIGLDGSNTGAYYQLMNGITSVGSPMAGTGLPLDFGLQTAPGTYTVMATGTATSCSNTMTGSQSIVVDALPTAYTVTGGGNYCSGGLGSDVQLSGSDPGVSYQLFAGSTSLGAPMSGTGSALDFGPQTASGTYVVVATNTTTSCTNSSSGSVSVAVNPPPTPYNVTGGGLYCSGGSGVHVSVNSSDVGTQYQLMLGGVAVGAPIAGTGFGLDFGLQTATGSYTIQATNTATSCVGLMTGSAVVGASALPTVYNVSSSGSSYCAGGSGVDITLSGSDLGTQYQLYQGAIAIGSPVSGTGLPVDFGPHTAGGTYTVVAINTGTSCTANMSGAAAVTVSPLPTAYTVTGGGSYCSGGTGVNIGLSSSNVGVTYQLFTGGVPVSAIIPGTGSAINFGLQTAAGSYTVVATNSTTSCTNNMSGTATVAVNPAPASYTVTGGGNYCSGGAGVHVGISGSALGTNYQLLRGTTPVSSVVSGTGFAIDFGAQTAAGTYTIVATNATTGCSRTMSGSAVVGINAAPASYTVIGGGNYCPGGVGLHIGLSGSATGVSYQLYNGTAMVGSAAVGTGSAIDFGLQTAAGTYTVLATNATTSCTSTMSGSATIIISSLPAVYSVVGGGNYCSGGAGVHIGLSGSASGISYQAYNGFTAAGAPVIGTGSALDLGTETGAGTYTVIATDPTTSCTSNMSGTATVGVNPLVTPAVTISTGMGDTVCSGQAVTFTAMAVNGGGSPAYQWSVNGTVAGVGSSYTYIPLNSDVVSVTLTSNATCATPTTATSSVGMTVFDSQMPTISISAAPGSVVCQGTIVNFSATSAYGGSAPVYSWLKNNINVGSSPTYSTTPANGDVIYCVLSSNYHCRLANNVQSNHITMEVDNAVLPVVTVAAHPGGTLAPGEQVTFVATITSGGGPSPSYQWLVNGAAITGANSSTYTTSSLQDGDSVTCQVLSSGGCSGLAGFNSVTVHVRGVGVPVVNASASDIKLVPNPNNGTFTLKGTLGTTADQDVTFEITDMLGQVVYRGSFTSHGGEVNQRVQLSKTLANGMYMLNLHSGAANQVFHVVIEQ